MSSGGQRDMIATVKALAEPRISLTDSLPKLCTHLWRPATLVILLAFLFFYRLGERDLWGSHEARAAQNAQRMLDDGVWGQPRLFDDQYDLQKPPLYYWLVAGVTRVLGGRVDAWTERLPAALCASACVGIVFLFLYRRGRPVAAFLAAIVLATAQHFTWLARTGRIDMPLTLAVTVGVLALTSSRRTGLIAALALAVGMLLKGPIGLALPLAVVVSHWLIGRWLIKIPQPAWWRLTWITPTALALAAPWFIWANWQTDGEFFQKFFWYHNVQRAMGTADELAVHPWWYYGPRLLVDAAPWTLFILPALLHLSRRGLWRQDHEARLGLVWLVAVVGLLSCAQFKRADYLLPAYVGMALVVGCVGEQVWLQLRPQIRRLALAASGALLTMVATAWLYVLHVELPRHETEREQKRFASAIRDQAPAPQPVLFFRAEAHLLAFHLGRPVNTFLEWENLDVWAGRPGTHYLVMPPECAAEWREHVTSGALEEVLRNTDLSGGRHEKPLVLMRTRPHCENPNGAPRQQAADRRRPSERGDCRP